MERLIDITKPICITMLCSPGRAAPQFEWERRIDRGDHCNTSVWRMSAHTGTHIEASLHFIEVGLAIDQVPPEIFIGECTVIDFKERGATVLDEAWADELRGALRLLIRSDFSEADQSGAYPDHGPLLKQGAAEILLESGLKLLGTDRYSVDASTRPEFTLHHQLLSAGCVIVEGLLLAQISAGKYGLIVAPLPLVGAEASPARAFLTQPAAD